ncbi:S1 family peptidase [Carboxylicivirga marina]|uniref:Trypsin-like peptidase domain-containing protein n=1 Tax=Carboxylicivirga marina TaxID=2800988 RepID=A0ABS1HH93_9BACT|nr:serine protease [Carboxylicivirga marina]MBK3516995.1 trypsin-like peptidase domain-containing protein [Carboxylicivirga marina]
MKPTLYLTCILLCYLYACNNYKTSGVEEVIEDIRYTKIFESKASDYYSKNGGTSSDTYKKQLLNEKCEVKLDSILHEANGSQNFYTTHKHQVLIYGKMYNCGNCPEWHISAATAFPISDDGICASNYHVFDSYNPDSSEDYETSFVMDLKKNIYPIVEVLAASKKDDLAIFRINCEPNTIKPLVLGNDLVNGGDVCLISHPDSRYYTFTQGILNRTYIKPKEGILRQSMSAAFARGSSGAPVLDSTGKVVGIVAGTSPVFRNGNPSEGHQMIVNEIVPVSRLRALIN